LLTAAIAPAGMVFTAQTSSGGSITASATGGRGTRGGAPGAARSGGAGGLATGGGEPPALILLGGSTTGITIDGDAVSVSVGNVSGGSAPESAQVPVVIAQYN